jgi:hypothetical protein
MEDFFSFFPHVSRIVHNPCPMPKCLLPCHLQDTSPADWWVTDKCDGERFQLMVGSDRTLMVSRSLGFYRQPHCDTAQQTLLDGEMLLDRGGNKMYCIFDCHTWKGENVTHLDIQERLAKVDLACVQLGFSVFKKPLRCASLLASSQTVGNFSTDGFIFIKKGTQFPHFATDDMLKWKPMVTVDLVGYDGNFFARDRQMYVDAGLNVTNPEFVDSETEVWEIALQQGSAQVIGKRPDKKNPNSIRTLSDCIEASAITQQNLYDWVLAGAATTAASAEPFAKSS